MGPREDSSSSPSGLFWQMGPRPQTLLGLEFGKPTPTCKAFFLSCRSQFSTAWAVPKRPSRQSGFCGGVFLPAQTFTGPPLPPALPSGRAAKGDLRNYLHGHRVCSHNETLESMLAAASGDLLLLAVPCWFTYHCLRSPCCCTGHCCWT